MSANIDIPRRIFKTGSLNELPRFDVLSQLCASSNCSPSTTSQVPPQLKRKAQNNTEEALNLLLECMGTKRWSVNELHAHANAKNGTKMKVDTVREYLKTLTNRKQVIKSMAGKPYRFWRAQNSS